MHITIIIKTIKRQANSNCNSGTFNIHSTNVTMTVAQIYGTGSVTLAAKSFEREMPKYILWKIFCFNWGIRHGDRIQTRDL